MKTLIAALLASTVAFPAFAGDAFSTGDSHGPRQPNGQTDESYEQTRPAKPKTLSWAEQPIAANGYANGFVDPSPGDLKRQQAINDAAARESYDEIVDNGGCRAPVLPTIYAIKCDGFLASHKAFGGDQNGQIGSTGGD